MAWDCSRARSSSGGAPRLWRDRSPRRCGPTPSCSSSATDRSVAFYQALGFEARGRLPIRDEAINVFMGLPGDGDRLELTYNFGVDSYELGTGYGHIAITVEDLDATLKRLAAKGIEPEKPPYSVREGGSRLCFVRDPDGYRVEMIERGA